jgi:hypothetical protein
MASLKNNIDSTTAHTESLIKDYLKLFSIAQSQKVALLLGILSTVFILSTLLLIIVVFCSFALASYLNDILAGSYWGFWIVAAFYLLVIVLIVVRIMVSKTPLMANLFARFVISVLDIDIDHEKSIKGLKLENKKVKEKIESDKTLIKSDFEILRYSLLGSLLQGFLGLFKTAKKPDKKPAKKPAKGRKKAAAPGSVKQKKEADKEE